MTEVQWHWIKDHDYPKDGQDVWCIYRMFSVCDVTYGQNVYSFSNDLYKLSKYDFTWYKKKCHKGFYNYDSDVGYYEVNDVICWCELPALPEELKNNL